MAVTVATFREGYPEFADCPDSLVQFKLDEAAATTWQPVFDSTPEAGRHLYEQITYLYCAKYLALSPYARKMALVDDKGATLYDQRIRQLTLTATSGFRVL